MLKTLTTTSQHNVHSHTPQQGPSVIKDYLSQQQVFASFTFFSQSSNYYGGTQTKFSEIVDVHLGDHAA